MIKLRQIVNRFTKYLISAFSNAWCPLIGVLLTVFCFVALPDGVAADKEQVLLKLPPVPSGDSSRPADRAARKIYLLFKKQHPEIKIQSGYDSLGSSMQFGEQSFLMAQAAGIAEDVLEVNTRQIRSFINQEFICPLNRTMPPQDLKKFSTAIPEKIKRLVLDPDGTLWAVPFTIHGVALYWRKDLFLESAAELKQAGLDPERPPRTWEELAKYAWILTKPPSKTRQRPQYGFGLWNGFDAGYGFTNFVWSNGGNMVQKVVYCPHDGTRNEFPKEQRNMRCTKCGAVLADKDIVWEVAFNSKKGVEALEFLQHLRWTLKGKGKSATPVLLYDSAWTLYRLFKKGELAIVPADTDISESLGRLDFDPAVTGICAFPSKNQNTPGVSAITVGMYAINGHLKNNPARARAAWTYIRYLLSDEAQKIKVDYRVANGEAAFISPELLKKYHPENLDEVDIFAVNTQKDILKHGRTIPSINNYDKISTRILQDPIDAVMNGRNVSAQNALDTAAAKANIILKAVSPEVKSRRRRVAGYIAIVVGVFFVFIIYLIVRSFTAMSKEWLKQRSGGRRNRTLWAVALLAPAVTLVILWKYIPLIRGALLAFLDYRIMNNSGTFVGLDNFIAVYCDPWFYHCLLMTLEYILITMTIGFAAPIILAIMLNEVPRGKIFWRSVFFLPCISSGLIVIVIWKESLYDASPEGLLNKYLVPSLPFILFALLVLLLIFAVNMVRSMYLENRSLPAKLTGIFFCLLAFGLNLYLCGRWGQALFSGKALFPPQTWLKDPRLAMLCLVAPSIWASSGIGSLIYIAALKGVPDDLYEAAEVDGAGIIQKTFHIVLPTIKPLIIISFIGNFIASFQGMEGVLLMTQGGPQGATHVLGYEIWLKAFVYLEYGYATVIGWSMAFGLIGFTIYNLRILRNMKFSTTG